jgi:hypothetical protein
MDEWSSWDWGIICRRKKGWGWVEKAKWNNGIWNRQKEGRNGLSKRRRA